MLNFRQGRQKTHNDLQTLHRHTHTEREADEQETKQLYVHEIVCVCMCVCRCRIKEQICSLMKSSSLKTTIKLRTRNVIVCTEKEIE